MDKDDLKWLTNEDKYCSFLNFSMKIFVPKPLGFTKLSHFSEMLDDALMHRDGVMG